MGAKTLSGGGGGVGGESNFSELTIEKRESATFYRVKLKIPHRPSPSRGDQ